MKCIEDFTKKNYLLKQCKLFSYLFRGVICSKWIYEYVLCTCIFGKAHQLILHAREYVTYTFCGGSIFKVYFLSIHFKNTRVVKINIKIKICYTHRKRDYRNFYGDFEYVIFFSISFMGIILNDIFLFFYMFKKKINTIIKIE